MKGWVIPPEQSSDFVAHMERVLDVYRRPYDKSNPVVCMDESPKQLLGDARESLPIKPGSDKREDYEFVRFGVVNIFMANEPLAGNRMVEVTSTKKKDDWARFIKRISDEMYPEAERITLVMDNFKTHSPSSLYETFAPEEAKRIWDRFEFVFTPRHGSWLNMAEIELHVLNGQCLNRHIATMDKVKSEVEAWQDSRNNREAKINWQFTKEDARVKLRRLYPTIET